MFKVFSLSFGIAAVFLLASPLLSFANSGCDELLKNTKDVKRLYEKVLNCELGLGDDEFAAAGDDGLVTPATLDLALAGLPGGDINLSSLSGDSTTVPGGPAAPGGTGGPGPTPAPPGIPTIVQTGPNSGNVSGVSGAVGGPIELPGPTSLPTPIPKDIVSVGPLDSNNNDLQGVTVQQ